MHGLNAVERAYERLWSMAYRTWQIEHRGEFRLALRRATSLPRGNKRDYESYKTLVRWRFASALRGSARGFWGEFRLALRRATSLPRGNKRDYESYKTLVRWRFASALCGSARGFWFIDPLGLRPRGLCTVATRARHVNHVPPSYNYNVCII